MPYYWIECLHSERTGYDCTAPVHKQFNQQGKVCCHWFKERKVREQWSVIVRGRRREISKIRMMVGMKRGEGALAGGKAMDKDCCPRKEGV